MRRTTNLLIFVGSWLGALPLACKPAAPPVAQLPPAEVMVSRALQQEVTDALEFTGTTAALESVEVRARVTGFLQEIHFQAPAKISKDDGLFTIDPRPFKAALDAAQADLDSQQAQLAKAEFDFKRYSDLHAKGSATEEEMVKATAVRDSTQASVEAARAAVEDAGLKHAWCEVAAPINGRISRNLIDVGNIVTADATVMATIVNDADINAYFNVSERDLLTLRERSRQERAAAGQDADSQPELRDVNMPAYLGLMTQEGHPHVGVINYAAPELDAATGTIQVRARFPNANGQLIPGLFARIRVPVGQPYPALRVTERALGSDQGQRYLLVVTDKNVVEYRPVQVGTLENGLRVVSAGLKPEEWVIVSGIQRVRPGVTVKPVQTDMPVGPVAGATSQPTSVPAKAANGH